jgi:hypothetical protein
MGCYPPGGVADAGRHAARKNGVRYFGGSAVGYGVVRAHLARLKSNAQPIGALQADCRQLLSRIHT